MNATSLPNSITLLNVKDDVDELAEKVSSDCSDANKGNQTPLDTSPIELDENNIRIEENNLNLDCVKFEDGEQILYNDFEIDRKPVFITKTKEVKEIHDTEEDVVQIKLEREDCKEENLNEWNNCYIQIQLKSPIDGNADHSSIKEDIMQGTHEYFKFLKNCLF